MSQSSNTWKNKHLVFVFMACLLVFTVIRWDIDGWIQGQLDTVIEQNNMPIQYRALSLHGTTLELQDVHLDMSDMSNMPNNTPQDLRLDKLQMSLDWAALASAELAILIHANNAFVTLQASISQHESRIKVSDILVQVDVSAAQAWYGQALLAQLAGAVVLQGDIVLDVSTRLPVQTDLTLAWQGAQVSMMQQVYALGDYTLQLTQSAKSEQAESQGKWLLQGGEALKLQGNGTLQMNQVMVGLWPLQGEISVQLGAESPLKVFLPQANKMIKLTGTLGQPQWTM
ncbi:MAG: hypothetical protein Q9M20_04605 [Mariprofundaceae bacterium]|nr:hypothetical protein [Mariprofundaceae bacterium]